MKETMLMKEVWVPANEEFRFAESIEDGEKRFILSGMMLPFNTVSRNSVLYNEESVRDKCEQLVGKPLMYNHKIEGDELPKGHFIKSWCENDGWYYKADVDPAEKEFIRKLNRKDLRHVSIQLVGGKIVEREDKGSGNTFTEAWVEDVIEGSVVPAPGFLDTTASFAEAFKQGKINEDEKDALLKAEPELKKEIEEGAMSNFHAWLMDKGINPNNIDKRKLVKLMNEWERSEKEEINTTTAGGAVGTKVLKPEDEESLKKVEEYIQNANMEDLKDIL